MPAFPKYTHGSVNILELFAEVFDLSTNIGDGTGHKTSLELILAKKKSTRKGTRIAVTTIEAATWIVALST